MSKVDRSVLSNNDQQYGNVADPNKIETMISHLADVIDTNDNVKTDKTGDHLGTWNGLKPNEIGSETMNAARLTLLENKPLARYQWFGNLAMSQNVWFRFPFNGVAINIGEMYVTNEDTFLIKEAGWYRFYLQLKVDIDTGLGFTAEVRRLNTTVTFFVLEGTGIGNAPHVLTGESLVYCEPGELYEFVGKSASPSTRNLHYCIAQVQKL